MSTQPDDAPQHRLILVTGPAGGGRTTAIRALEDLNYEAIDNIPLSLMPRLFDGPPVPVPLAVGVDTRNREFTVQGFLKMLTLLENRPDVEVEVLYLDCRREVLVRRYSETRRRHPMAPDDIPTMGIDREIELLAPIQARASVLIDTSELTIHDLRAEIARWFVRDDSERLAVAVQSFSYKRGLPHAADLVFDCRFLRNPHWEETLRPYDGRDAPVAEYVEGDERFGPFFDQLTNMLELLLPAYRAEGKSHLTIAFGCTGGQHRSVMMAEKMAKALAGAGWQVSTRHREIERRAAEAPKPQVKDDT